jgi:hypothetical protein
MERLQDEPAVGMRPDGTLEILRRGQPKPQPVAIVEDQQPG